MKFKGVVVEIGPTEKMGKNPDKPFIKRVLVVDDSEEGAKYKNPVPFEATAEKCNLLNSLRKGDRVEVSFFLAGREWKDKSGKTRYFGSNRILSLDIENEKIPDIPMRGDDTAEQGEDAEMPF